MRGELDHQAALRAAEYGYLTFKSGIDRGADSDQDGATATFKLPAKSLEFFHDFSILKENNLAVVLNAVIEADCTLCTPSAPMEQI